MSCFNLDAMLCIIAERENVVVVLMDGSSIQFISHLVHHVIHQKRMSQTDLFKVNNRWPEACPGVLMLPQRVDTPVLKSRDIEIHFITPYVQVNQCLGCDGEADSSDMEWCCRP